jgi:hypothetical protein
METQSPTKRDLETALIEKCWKDPEFKKAVVRDPRGVLEQRAGRKLPPNFKIFIHEEDANTLHLTIPPAPSSLTELSEDDLEKVAGGTEIGVATGIILATASAALVTAVGAGIGGGITKSQGW